MRKNLGNVLNIIKKSRKCLIYGFSPDADFPCIYAEKGISTLYIKDNYSKYKDLPISILKIDCNNNAINVVPKYCSTTILIDTSRIDLDYISDFIETEIKKLCFNITFSINDNSIELKSFGIQAHSAHPDLGKNAISPMIILLNRIFNKFDCPINMFNFFEKYIGNEFNGESLNLNVSDETGNLTLNVGSFGFYENFLQIGINLRIPTNTPIKDVTNSILKQCEINLLDTYMAGVQEPLYVPKENVLVKTLCDIFNKKTDCNLEPIAIGGGTYARAFDNCISFGANFPGDIDMCHQANEFINIDKITLASKIYAEAIHNLANYF